MNIRIITAVTILCATPFFAPIVAQEKNAGGNTDAAIHASLREVINTGADLFNLQSDYLGCYRLYQGSLIVIQPLLKPDLRSKVETSLRDAEKLPNFVEKAAELRKAIDIVRARTRPPTTQSATRPPELIVTAPERVK